MDKLSENALSERKMNELRGGGRLCGCNCQGTSSIDDNMAANYSSGSTGYGSVGTKDKEDCDILMGNA